MGTYPKFLCFKFSLHLQLYRPSCGQFPKRSLRHFLLWRLVSFAPMTQNGHIFHASDALAISPAFFSIFHNISTRQVSLEHFSIEFLKNLTFSSSHILFFDLFIPLCNDNIFSSKIHFQNSSMVF